MSNFPLPSFNFTVQFAGINTNFSFSEVSGIKAAVEYQEVNDGTQITNHFRVPKRVKYDEVTLKKGISGSGKNILELFKNIQDGKLNGRTLNYEHIIISLLNEKGESKITWTLNNCWIVSWEFSAMNAMNNEIMMETLVISYAELKIS